MPIARRVPNAAWIALIGIAAFMAVGCASGQAPFPARHRMYTIDGPAGQLFVDDGGRGGVPVLFVHSFGGSTAHWRTQLKHLRQERRAVAMDLRGHGESDSPRSGGYTVDAMAQDIAAVADALKLKRFVLVGHSMGGAAAAAYAGKYRDRVAGLVLVGTPGKADPVQAAQVLAGIDSDYDNVVAGYWKSLIDGAQPNARSLLEADMRRMQREPSTAMIRSIFANDPLPSLSAYRGPKFIIDTPHGDGRAALYRQAPQIPRRVITGTSHWPQLDKPVEFNALMDEFLYGAR